MTLEMAFHLFFGLLLLVIGSEWLVQGARQLALRLGVSSLVIGLTVVAYGTSTPELVVSTLASMQGQHHIAVANVVGSNIFNVFLILGLCAMITPLKVSLQLIRIDVPIMIGVSGLLFWFVQNQRLEKYESLILLAGILLYSGLALHLARKQPVSLSSLQASSPHFSWPRLVFLVLLGLGSLIAGAKLFVDSSVELARTFGINETVIGLTVVAVGTSLPELATSLMAAFKGEKDVAVGNIVGSNIYNILGILGFAGLLSPQGLSVDPALIQTDLPVMIAAAIACLPFFVTGHSLSRLEGALFFGYSLVYLYFLILTSEQHSTLSVFNTLMRFLVIPLTGLTFLICTLRISRHLTNKGAAR